MKQLISKQPLFNKFGDIICYELQPYNYELTTTQDPQLTIELLYQTFISSNVTRITQKKSVFIHFPEQLIMNDFLNKFDHTSLIISIRQITSLNDAFINRFKELKNFGYRIAIDSCLFSTNSPLHEQLLSFCDFCLIDFEQHTYEKRIQFERFIRKNHAFVRLIAYNIHTQATYEIAKDTGYSLFKGNFFMEPQKIEIEDIPFLSAQYIQLFELFQEDVPDIGLITELIETDVSLSYKILQLANTVSEQLHVKITSIRQAIMLLGLIELQKWIYLMAMREHPRHSVDIERELLMSSLRRAKICEQLARNKLKANYAEFYLVGMFSNIDTILAYPMDEILQNLPVSELIKQTLLGQETNVTPFLQLAIAIDLLQWDKIFEYSATLQIDINQVELIYGNAFSWVEDLFSSLLNETF